MSDVFDLNALIPQSIKIKYDNDEIEIKPPKTVDILKLGVLGQKLQAPDKLEDVELEKLVADLTDTISSCIPELTNKPLTTTQLLFLLSKIVEMGTPPDLKELEKRGITVDTPKKAL